MDFLGDLRIFAAREPWAMLDDCDAAPEASIGLRQLNADISATEDDEVIRNSVEFERLNVRERLSLSQARY